MIGAGPNYAQPLDMSERWDVCLVFAGHFPMFLFGRGGPWLFRLLDVGRKQLRVCFLFRHFNIGAQSLRHNLSPYYPLHRDDEEEEALLCTKGLIVYKGTLATFMR